MSSEFEGRFMERIAPGSFCNNNRAGRGSPQAAVSSTGRISAPVAWMAGSHAPSWPVDGEQPIAYGPTRSLDGDRVTCSPAQESRTEG
jgi:hypothetical protein